MNHTSPVTSPLSGLLMAIGRGLRLVFGIALLAGTALLGLLLIAGLLLRSLFRGRPRGPVSRIDLGSWRPSSPRQRAPVGEVVDIEAREVKTN